MAFSKILGSTMVSNCDNNNNYYHFLIPSAY